MSSEEMKILIEVNNLSKVFKNGGEKVVALEGVNLKIYKGEYLAVVGPSGAGKSTFLHILGGLELPTGGEVLFNGENIFSYGDRRISLWRSRNVGFIFQFYHLIEELTVIENIIIAGLIAGQRVKTSFKKAQNLLKYLNIESKESVVPSRLSGGEKQKVAIARALVNDAGLILCDEPTGNLDRQSATRVRDLLTSLHREKKKTVVVVTHNEDLSSDVERVVHLKGGRVV